MSVSADTTLDLSGKTIGLDPSVASEELPTTSILIDVRSGTTTLDGDGVVSAEAGYNNSYADSGERRQPRHQLRFVLRRHVRRSGCEGLPASSTVVSSIWLPPSRARLRASQAISSTALTLRTRMALPRLRSKAARLLTSIRRRVPEVGSPSFVADGYKVVSETQSNGEVWYTVVPE